MGRNRHDSESVEALCERVGFRAEPALVRLCRQRAGLDVSRPRIVGPVGPGTMTVSFTVCRGDVCERRREAFPLEIATKGDVLGAVPHVFHEACLKRNCYPSPLNYMQFPKSVCTSVNEVICHGVPDGYELQKGDIINLDVTVYHNGFHADLNETYFVGGEDAVE